MAETRDKAPKREVEPRRALTAVRGLAAWWVVAFHFRESLPNFTPAVVRHAAAAGYLAVDLFFILSGYVIALNYSGWFTNQQFNPYRYMRFLVLRLSRIYPLHAFMLILFPLLPLTTLVFSSGHATGGLFPGYYIQSIFLIQAWGFSPELHWNVPAWSISTEWFAYLIFPLLAVGAAKVCRTGSRTAIFMVAMLALLAVLAATLSRSGLSDASSIFALLRCLIEFSVGAAIYHFGQRAQLGWERRASLLIAGCCFAATALWALPDYLLIPFAFAALVHGMADETGMLAAVLRWEPLQWLGIVSYSTYMSHYFLKACVKLALVRPGIPEVVPFVAYLLAVLVASALLHYGVERPGQRMLRQRFVGRP